MSVHPLEAEVRAGWQAGLSTGKIAAGLGLSRGAVAGVIYRARERGAAWAAMRPSVVERAGAEIAGTLSDAELLVLLAARERGIAIGRVARAVGRSAADIHAVLAAIDADLAASEAP